MKLLISGQHSRRYGNQADDNLRGRIVFGILQDFVKKTTLPDAKLTLQKAFTIGGTGEANDIPESDNVITANSHKGFPILPSKTKH